MDEGFGFYSKLKYEGVVIMEFNVISFFLYKPAGYLAMRKKLNSINVIENSIGITFITIYTYCNFLTTCLKKI